MPLRARPRHHSTLVRSRTGRRRRLSWPRVCALALVALMAGESVASAPAQRADPELRAGTAVAGTPFGRDGAEPASLGLERAATNADGAAPSPHRAPPPLPTLAADLGLTAASAASLARGEAVVLPLPPTANEDRSAAEAARGRALRVLPAPAERLARAAADWPHYAEFFPFVSLSEVVAGSLGSAPRVRQRIDVPFPFPDRRLTVETEWMSHGDREVGEPDFEVAWHHVAGSGNVDAQEGRWRFWRLADTGDEPPQTLVELRLLSDSGAGIPQSLEERALLETLEWALDGLRQQVHRCRYDRPRHPTCGESEALPPTGLDEVATVERRHP